MYLGKLHCVYQPLSATITLFHKQVITTPKQEKPERKEPATKMPRKLAIPTASLGHVSAGHTLTTKLDAAQAHGYQGVEITQDDLFAVATRHLHHGATTAVRMDDQLRAAEIIQTWCQSRGLHIICLQPFTQYEGLADQIAYEGGFDKLLVSIQLARVLGTDLILIPASSLPAGKLAGDNGLGGIVNDLQRAADAGLQTPGGSGIVRFAYEPRCSATPVDRWEFGWEVLERVARPNFGMCLDTFHIAGLYFADPAVPSGLVPGGDQAVRLSMRRLVECVKAHRDRIFLVQMGDARRPDEPIARGSPEYKIGQTPRAVWSGRYRLFYGEEARGGYLPVQEISDAIFNGVGYEGWVSMELFSQRMKCADPKVPMELARRGAIAWRKLASDMGWWPTLPNIKTSVLC